MTTSKRPGTATRTRARSIVLASLAAHRRKVMATATLGLMLGGATALPVQARHGAIINPTNLTITYGPENFRKLILEPILESPVLNTLFTITDNIKAKVDILFIGRFKKVTVLDTGCGTAPTTPAIDTEKVTWDPVALEAWIAECAKDFDGTFMAWGLAAGYKRYDLEQAKIKIARGMLDQNDEQEIGYWNEFIQTMMEQAITDDIFRIGYFGNTSITAGQLTGGAEQVKNYNQLNGIWKQIIVKGAAVKVTSIAGNTATDQALVPGEARSIFVKLIRAKDNRRLLSKKFGTPVIFCTQSLWDNWVDDRASNDKLQVSWEVTETGIVSDKVLGVQIIPIPELDEILAEDFAITANSVTTIDKPHRALLTTKENLQLGFDSYDDALMVEGWYNRDTKKTNMRGNFKMDAKVMRNFLTRAAY